MLVAAICVFGSPYVQAASHDDCEKMDMEKVVSPDGRWMARIYGRVCDLGLMASAGVIVDLGRAVKPGIFTAVLDVDMPSDKKNWPKAIWKSSKSLILKLPANASIGFQAGNYKHIDIRVKFCPGGAAAHKEWEAYHAAYGKWLDQWSAWITAAKRDPRTAGPRPLRPKLPEEKPDPSCER